MADIHKNGFDLIALYGRNTGHSDNGGECEIYELNNETGAGRITVYNVFSGINAAFNDIHMGYCNKEQSGSRNVIEINHCMEGHYECSVGERLCCYMSHGDVAVKSSDIGSENSCFPTSHYHGISIFIETDKLSDELLAIMKTLSIDLNRVKALTENENSLFMLRKSEAADHIFSELYTVRENTQSRLSQIKDTGAAPVPHRYRYPTGRGMFSRQGKRPHCKIGSRSYRIGYKKALHHR